MGASRPPLRLEIQDGAGAAARPAAPVPARTLSAATIRLVQGALDPRNQHLLAAWPTTLITLAEVAEATLRRLPADTDPADAARAIVLAQATYLGGRSHKLPSPAVVRRLLRDAAIWREWTGSNAQELAVRHRLDITAIYRVLRAQRALHKAARERRRR